VSASARCRPRRAAEGKPGTTQDAAGLKLHVEAAGYQVFERADIAVLEGQDNDLGVVRLEPAPVVSVLVLDAATKEPVADAQVSLLEEKPEARDFRGRIGVSIDDDSDDGEVFAVGSAQRARTGADGRAADEPPGKSARLRVRHAGHSEYRSEPIALPAKEDLEETVRLGVGGSVTVTVVDPRGAHDLGRGDRPRGSGPERRGLRVLRREPPTDAEGKLAFEHLPPGSHRFRLGKGRAAASSTSAEGTP
jgi:hypothetical protein